MDDGSKSRTSVTLAIDSQLSEAASAESLDLVELLEWAIRRRLNIPLELSEEEKAAMKASAEWLEHYVKKHGHWWQGLRDETPKRIKHCKPRRKSNKVCSPFAKRRYK